MNTLPQQRYKISDNRNIAPAAGRMITNAERAQLPLGAYSNLENVRIYNQGLEMRGGLIAHNQTAEASSMIQLYSYKNDVDDTIKFWAQLSDGDIVEADTLPPSTDANDFGDVVMDFSALKGDASGTVLPGSFSKHKSAIIHSNGGMQHVIYPGSEAIPLAVFYKTDTSLSRILQGGKDLTQIVTDFESTEETGTITFTIANEDGVYICCEYPAESITLNLGSDQADGTTTLKVQYFDESSDGFTDATTGTDGTNGLQQDGTITFTKGTDEIPTWMFGLAGYWYRLYLSAGDATETFTLIDVSYTGPWQTLTNVMHSFTDPVIEAQVEVAGGAEYETYAASSVDISSLTSGDYIYFATLDNIWAVLVDVGATPNTGTSATLTMEGWTEASGWAAVTSVEDDTSAFKNSGFISWKRSDSYDKQAFNDGGFHMYWWRMKLDQDVSSSCIIALSTLNTYNIKELGITGRVSTMWKNRAVYTFGKFARDIYVSALNRTNVLNGSDTTVLTPGDGRRNPVSAMKQFHNELMVWQEEEGSEGGTLTIFQGYSPSTFGKLVLSTRLGTFSQKSAVVIDGSTMTTRQDDKSQTIAIFISHWGIYLTDGRVVMKISGDIDNYFDPAHSEVITRGQEAKMWCGYDGSKHVVRFGLVSGSGQTKCNVFPVYHLHQGVWSFDTYPTGADGTGIYPECFAEVEANSGDLFSLQYLGCTYGRAYRSNNSVTYDAATDTNAYITCKSRAEFSHGGNKLDFRELVLRAGSNSDYTLTKKIYEMGVLDSNETETFDMDATEGSSSYDVYRERILQRNYTTHQMSIELSWQDTEGDGGDQAEAPKMYDFLYEIGVAPQRG